MSAFVEAIARVPPLHRAGSFVTSRLKRWSVDVAVAGFPKCGNTWTSALLRALIIERFGLPQDRFSRLFVSDLGALPVAALQLPRGIPRLYQTHFMPIPFRADLSGIAETLAPFRDTPMIVLIRDPKDALVSYFVFNVRRFGFADAPREIDDFVWNTRYGLPKYIGYYNIIAESRRKNAPTRVVSYEERWADPVRALADDAVFMGLDAVPPDMLERVVRQYDFQHMREMELASSKEKAVLTPLWRADNDDPEAAFVRKGGSGNWREHMSDRLAAEIDAAVAANLDPMFRAPLGARTR